MAFNYNLSNFKTITLEPSQMDQNTMNDLAELYYKVARRYAIAVMKNKNVEEWQQYLNWMNVQMKLKTGQMIPAIWPEAIVAIYRKYFFSCIPKEKVLTKIYTMIRNHDRR